LVAGLQDILAQTICATTWLEFDAPQGLQLIIAHRGKIETAPINLATNAR